MTHDELRSTLGVHALGALSAAEAREVEDHVAGCRLCAEELDELRDTAAEIARLADPLPPSAAVTRRILGLVPGSAVRRSAPRAGADRALEPTRPALRSASPVGPTLGSRFGRLAVAAVIVILVVSQINLLGELNDALRLIERTREVGEFITSPDVSVIPLWGSDSDPAAHAKLAYDRGTGRVILLSSRIPAPPAGKTYQLWAISERMEPAGIFSPGSDGGTVLADYRPAANRSFVFAVTLESTSGAGEPTGEMLLLSGPLGAR